MKKLPALLAGSLALVGPACSAPALPAAAPGPADLLFIDVTGVEPLRLWIDGALVFDGKVEAESPSYGLTFTMHVPLRGAHVFHFVGGRIDVTRTLTVTDREHFVLVNPIVAPAQALMVTAHPLLD